MKPKLNRKDQAKQNKISRKLSLGQSLSRLFGGSKEKPGQNDEPEEVPEFVTEGIMPTPGIKRKPKVPPKPGKGKGRSAASNRESELPHPVRTAGEPAELDEKTGEGRS